MTLEEITGDWPSHPDRGREEDTDSRGLPNPYQTAPDKSRGESSKENPQENKKQGKCQLTLLGGSYLSFILKNAAKFCSNDLWYC